MSLISNPVSFSEHFGVAPEELGTLGILDPILNVDTKLFIDPVLLKSSSHVQLSRNAEASFSRHFSEIIALLRVSRSSDDIPWEQARKRLTFHEVAATCLGYGASTIRGSAFGARRRAVLLRRAKQIVDLGVDDPNLFKLLPVLDDGVGPDLISDLTTNVIKEDLADFTQSTCERLSVPTKSFRVGESAYRLPVNPTQPRMTPVLLVPLDVLRSLPIASDWDEIADVIQRNAMLRRRVNRLIGDIWTRKVRHDKAKLRAAILANKRSFETALQVLLGVRVKPYDRRADSEGLFAWQEIRRSAARESPLKLGLPSPPDRAAAVAVVSSIVLQFQKLVEKKGIWKAMWSSNSKHRNEKSAQMLFFAVADSYCIANNLDVTPEADTGSGVVDFKFSEGYSIRILVEVKLSSNPRLVAGYERQLEAYTAAETPARAFYLVVIVGDLGHKVTQLTAARNAKAARSESAPELVLVDARPKRSASRL